MAERNMLGSETRAIATGEVSGSITAKRLPSLACTMVNIQAAASNAGKVYLGGAGVTKPDGTTDSTTGWELAAGSSSGNLVVDNLNQLYIICDNAGDDVIFMAMQ